MKTDRYTKIILTVIAACMVINVLEKLDITPKAYANDKPAETTLPKAPAPNYALIPTNADGSIKINLTNSAPMDVNIVGIKTYDNLDVNVNLARLGGSTIYGAVPVKVDK
jgi:hypothetical protein